jgi:hypothetical protein
VPGSGSALEEQAGDTVEQGRSRPPPRPRRTQVLIGLVLLCLLLGGALVDHRVRRQEGDRVDRCRADATSAVRVSSARVDSIVSYVRPALDSPIPASLRRRLHGLIAVSVAPVVPGVRSAHRLCRGTHVLAVHGGLHATRANCLRLLDRDLAYLRAIVADGSEALGSRALPAGRCTRP